MYSSSVSDRPRIGRLLCLLLTVSVIVPLAPCAAADSPQAGASDFFLLATGGPNDDSAATIRKTADGGLIVSGLTTSFGQGGIDILLLKLTNDGMIDWAETLGSDADEGIGLNALQQTEDNGYIIAGNTNSAGAGVHDTMLIKCDSTGSIEWARTAGGPNWDTAGSVVIVAYGGYLVVGQTSSFGGQDALLLMYESNGDLLWARTVGGAREDSAYPAQLTADGGVIIAGHTESFGAGGTDVLVMKLTSLGELSWVRAVGGYGNDEAISVHQTADGGYLLSGRSFGYGPGDGEILLLKLDQTGELVWARWIGGELYDHGYSAAPTTDGGIIVAADSESFGFGGHDVLLLKLDTMGTLIWATAAGGPGCDHAHAVLQDANSYLVVGRTDSYGMGSSDLLIMRTGMNGLIPACPLTMAVSPVVTTPELSVVSPAVSVSDLTSTITITSPDITRHEITLPTDLRCVTPAVVFSDGFESGDTSAWSVADP